MQSSPAFRFPGTVGGSTCNAFAGLLATRLILFIRNAITPTSFAATWVVGITTWRVSMR